MSWRLGLDLGTNSIGWVAYALADAPCLLGTGVRIFGDGREPAAAGRVGEPLALARRMARQMRKQRDRKQLRKRELAAFIIDKGLLPKDDEARKRLFGNTDGAAAAHPLALRARAASEPKLDPYLLGRALMHLASRRGFLSNRKTDAGDKDDSQRKQEMRALDAEVAAAGQTLGQWLNDRRDANLPTRFRPDMGLFPTRALYEAEFDAIREKQAATLSEEDWDALRALIFRQRPLKPVPRGKCRFYPEEDRLHRAMPSAQRFRLAQDLAHLEWLDEDGQPHKLDARQRLEVLRLLARQGSLSFKSLRAKKGSDGQRLFPDAVQFNREDAKTTGLKGDDTAQRMKKAGIPLDFWLGLSLEVQDEIVETLLDSERDHEVRALAARHGFSSARTEALVAMSFGRQTMSVGPTIARDAGTLMIEDGLTYAAAVERLGFHHSREDEAGTHKRLPYYGEALQGSTMGAMPGADPLREPEKHWGKIANPTVHVALNQLRKVVNALIDRHGPPAQIVVETNRQLKHSAAEREEIMRGQAKYQARNEELRKEAISLGAREPKGRDLLKLRLWRELDEGSDALTRRCLYCGKTIAGHQLFNGDAEIDHILPFSRTMDDSRPNLTVAHKDCNFSKGNETPFGKWGHTDRWPTIAALAAEQPKSRRWRFQEDALDRFEAADYDVGDGGEKATGFIARQMTDNAYIARLARRYLRTVCAHAWSSSGQLTSLLRAHWRLNAPDMGLGEPPHPLKKDRADHRHHALDACVIGLIDRAMVKGVNTYSGADGRTRYVVPAMPPGLRDAIKASLAEIVVSHKPDHGLTGRFFNETAYGHIREDQRDPARPDYDLVTRKGLLDMNEKELSQIRNPDLRGAVAAFLAARAGDNAALKKKLEDFQAHWEARKKAEGASHPGKPKRARLLIKNDSAEPISSAPYKRYARGAYAFVDIWRVPKGKKGAWKKDAFSYEGRFVSYREAARPGIGDDKESYRPHPAAKFVMRLFKDDCVAISRGGTRHIMKVQGFSTTNNKLDIVDARAANPAQSYVSINKLCDAMDMKRLFITPDGVIRNREALTLEPGP